MKNPFQVEGNIVRIFLRHKGTIIDSTIIDADDLPLIARWSWGLTYRGYVTHCGRNFQTTLHQLLVGKKEGMVIDHINNNPLDNRRKNLQHITQKANVLKNPPNPMNCSKANMKKGNGVYFDRSINKWKAELCFYGVKYRRGGFKNRKMALNARKELEKSVWPN